MKPRTENRNLVSTAQLSSNIIGFYLSMNRPDLGLQIPTIVEDLTNYGCWCQIRNKEIDGVIAGKGEPIDILDGFCRDWQHCITCLKSDGCEWDSGIPYEVGFNGKRIICDSSPEGCSRNTCMVSIVLSRYVNFESSS